MKQELVLAADGILEKDCDKCNKNANSKKTLRDAQTSPQISPLKSPISPAFVKMSKKQLLLSPSKHETSPHHSRAQLEKSNSLGESKPAKQLRTTKSLSPRPPMRHQTAVNDENNVVNIKVSPAADDDGECEKQPLIKDKHDTNGLVESLRLDERHKNRSTSCLVYVPSDPWTKMDQPLQSNNNHQKSVKEQSSQQTKKRGENRMKKLMEVKSQSKPDLIDSKADNDPWVFDETRMSRDTTSRKSATIRHQSKSLHIDSKSGTARPRMQRSSSPKDPLSSLSPTLGYNAVASKNTRSKSSNGRKKQQQPQQYLNVSNPNLLQQSRHSFSTSPTSLTSSTAKTRDDELTLNIRRLSEQIKYSSTYGSYGNFHHGTSSSTVTSPKQIECMEKSASLLSDSLLETTC
jgi:hypothetical protein